MGGNLFINTLGTDPGYFFAVLLTVVISITLHELAHGYAAIKLGDDTPIYTGHMTLNPLVHMGVFSLILLAIAGIAFGAMPVDRTRLRGRYGEAIMAAAGPAMNFVLAAAALVGLGLWERFNTTPYGDWSGVAVNGKFLLMIFGTTNVVLGLFNLLPVPPLDGGWIAASLIPAYRRFLSNDAAKGVMVALFFAMFLGGASFIRDASDRASLTLLTTVSGRAPHHFGIIYSRKAAEAADKGL